MSYTKPAQTYHLIDAKYTHFNFAQLLLHSQNMKSFQGDSSYAVFSMFHFNKILQIRYHVSGIFSAIIITNQCFHNVATNHSYYLIQEHNVLAMQCK